GIEDQRLVGEPGEPRDRHVADLHRRCAGALRQPRGQRLLRGDGIALLRDGHRSPRVGPAELERVLADLAAARARAQAPATATTTQAAASAGPKGNSPRRRVTAAWATPKSTPRMQPSIKA